MSSFPKRWSYRPGRHKIIDDLNGFECYSDQVTERWDNVVVRHKDNNPRHPQDFLRGRKDKIQVDGPVRLEPDDIYMIGNRTGSDLPPTQ